MSHKDTVYIIDDDSRVRTVTSGMVDELGFGYHPFASGQDFLDSVDHLSPGCALLDVRMPVMSGLEVLERAAPLRDRLPIVLMTGHGDMDTAVSGMRLGAVDFLVKPFSLKELLDAIQRGLEIVARSLTPAGPTVSVNRFDEILTGRQKAVLQGMVGGLANKDIAIELGIAPRTVEMHRANLMSRLGVNSLAGVLRCVMDPSGGKRAA